MKFKFSLERLHRHRKIEEDIAQKEFKDAEYKVMEARRHCEELETQKTEAFLERERICVVGGPVQGPAISIESFLFGINIKIKKQLEIIRGLELILEEKRLHLVEALRSRKTLDKLKERKKRSFDQAKKQKELRTADDAGIMRFKKRPDI